MCAYRPGIDPDRRKGPDPLTKSLRWIAVLSWMIMFIILIILAIAKPDDVTFFDRQFGVTRNTSANLSLIRTIFYLMIFGFLLSLIGLIINLRRLRRRDDEYRISLILISIISFLGIIIYLLFL